MGEGLRVRVLGPVAVAVGGDVLAVRRLLERGLLVRLALARGVVVSDERLTADLWDDEDGDDARLGRLRVVVSRLRRTLGPAASAVERVGGGYRLAADVEDLRAASVAAERLHAAARSDDRDAVRRGALEALGAWQGPALSDLRALPFARVEGERLDAWRRELTVLRVDADLALGAGAELVGELAGLSAADPLHEKLRGMLAVALYRAGRQAEALAELAALRRTLADELGVDPTAETADLELRLLRQDADLRPPPALRPGAPAGATGATGATDIRPALARAIVGRRAELVALAARLDDARGGRPALVLVEGGPGAGRTRLLEALADLAGQHDLTVCWGRAATGGAPAFWPWRQALRQWKQRTPEATAAPVLARRAGPIARIAPELGPPTDAVPTGTGTGALDPDDRFGLFEHVVAFLEDAASATDGLVLLLDDLHVADLASLLLLAHVARSITAGRVLIAAALRPAELGAGATEARDEVLRQPATTRVELAGLGAAAVAEQLALVLERECEPDVAADVARRTGGNPLFVREIGRAMATGRDEVPTAIREAVRRQLEACSDDAWTVLAAAAVLAGEVEAALVAAAVGSPVADVLDELDAAVAAGLLARGERAERFRFAHAIVREAVGLDVGRGERARLHLRAAEHLESVGASEPRVAHHRLEALPLGDPARAVEAARGAADLALRQFAFEDAVGLYDRAIAATSTDRARAELLLGKTRALYLSHDVSGAMDACETAAALAEHLGDTTLLAQAATALPDVGDPAWLATTSRWCRSALAALPPGDGPQRARLMAQLAVASVWDDERISVDNARTVDTTGIAALAMAERVGDAPATYAALRARQLGRSGPEGTHERLELGGRMLGLVHDVGDPAELWGRLWRFDAFVQLGRIAEADDELDSLEPVVARMRQPLARWHLVRSRAAILSGRGRFPEARAAAEEAVRAAERGRHRAAEYPAHALRLTIALLTGDPVDPVVFEVERYQPPPRLLSMLAARWYAVHGELRDAEQVWARLPRPEDTDLKPFMHVLFHATSGALAGAVGDRRAVEHAYVQLLPHAALHVAAGAGVSATEGSVHRVLGDLAAALDRVDTAVDHLRAAVVANARSGLAPSTVLAQRGLAVALRRRAGTGDAEEAAGADAEGAATARRLGMPLP